MSHDLLVALLAAVVGAAVAWILGVASRTWRSRRSAAGDFAVMVFTLNENSKAIGSLESEVSKLGRKVAAFEGVLNARMNYRTKLEDE